MGILDSIKEFIGGAETASFALAPYTGKLPTKTIKKGSTGDDVTAWQTFLNWCMSAGLEKDGVFGPLTHTATVNWQKKYSSKYGIKPDGIVGEASRKAAKAIVNANAKAKTVKIGQACSDENGHTIGGKAGDQNGEEVAISSYTYSSNSSSPFHWMGVYRAKDTAARKKIADACIKACKNKHVGYDAGSSDRKSFYKEAKKKNWQIDKITTNCETTCSELANVCVAAAGLPHLGTGEQANVGTLPDKLMSSKKFTKVKLNKNKLQPGDILVSGCHTAVVVSVK